DPERTLFRVGSISKLFTGDAVMQLVDAGRLDLDRDASGYLDFTLPARTDGPITLRHLLTHRAGFEDVLKQLVVTDPRRAQPLSGYLKEHVPHRVYQAGSTPAYSNYAVSLAGYIVERAAGMSFEDYVHRYVFQPLGMTHSTFAQPVSGNAAADLSSGYLDPAEPPRPFTIYGPAPAGAMSSTGSDMANFMIARLADRKLAPTFLSYDRNGRRIVGHDGGDPVFRSNLRLFLDDHAGIFVSFNTIGPSGGVFAVRSELFEQFIDRYFPTTTVDEPNALTAREHARVAAGLYESSDQKASFFRVLRVLDQVTVTDNGDGTIALSNEKQLDGKPRLWREVAAWAWREVGGQATLEMTERAGRVTRIARSTDPTSVLMPAPRYRSSACLLPLLLGSVALLIVAVLTWPSAALAVPRPARAVALTDLLFLAGWAVLFQQLGAGHAEIFTSSLDPLLRVLQVIGLIGAIGSLVVLWNLVRLWQRTLSWPVRLFTVAIALGTLGFAWFGAVTGLLSQSLRY
ncbi:MAG TPA: serine hydrolase, partial [Gemmatimonadales bacterium]|nr:serine hydrolase [Gemmatimonadales bacterium]